MNGSIPKWGNQSSRARARRLDRRISLACGLEPVDRVEIPGTLRAMRSMRVVVLVLTMFLAGCRTLSHAKSKQEAAQRWNQVRGGITYQLARQHHDAGRFQDAVLAAIQALSLDPRQPDAYVVLAEANLELGKPVSALGAIEKAQMLGIESAELTYLQGVVMEQRGEVEAALEYYRSARRLDARNVDYLVAETECLVLLGQPDEALKLLDEHMYQFDQGGTIAALSGHVAAMRGDETDAAGRYRQALLSVSASRILARELGLLLTRSQRYEEARELLESVVGDVRDYSNTFSFRSDPAWNSEPDAAVRRALATCYLALNAPGAAKELLMECVASNPEDALAQVLLAKAAFATNDPLTAARAANQAFQLMPVEAEVQLVRAAAQWRYGNLRAAALTLRELLGRRPDDLEALCLLGEVHRAAGRTEAARRVFQEALNVDTTSAWAQQGILGLGAAGAQIPETVGNPPRTTLGLEQVRAATDGARHKAVGRTEEN